MVSKSLVQKLSTAAALVLAAAVAGYGMFLLLVGQRLRIYPEGGSGTSSVGQIAYAPTVVGLIPLAGGVATIAGLLAGRRWLTWLGFGLVLIYNILFLFGTGGPLLLVTPLLLVALAIGAILDRRPRGN
jgi:hypothetical protein